MPARSRRSSSFITPFNQETSIHAYSISIYVYNIESRLTMRDRYESYWTYTWSATCGPAPSSPLLIKKHNRISCHHLCYFKPCSCYFKPYSCDLKPYSCDIKPYSCYLSLGGAPGRRCQRAAAGPAPSSPPSAAPCIPARHIRPLSGVST